LEERWDKQGDADGGFTEFEAVVRPGPFEADGGGEIVDDPIGIEENEGPRGIRVGGHSEGLRVGCDRNGVVEGYPASVRGSVR